MNGRKDCVLHVLSSGAKHWYVEGAYERESDLTGPELQDSIDSGYLVEVKPVEKKLGKLIAGYTVLPGHAGYRELRNVTVHETGQVYFTLNTGEQADMSDSTTNAELQGYVKDGILKQYPQASVDFVNKILFPSA